MGYQYYLRNLQGTLMYKDLRVCKFVIRDRELVSCEYNSDSLTCLPWSLSELGYGLTYAGFNDFFKYRVVKQGAQDIREYLNEMEMDHYDFETLIKKMNGWDAVGQWWVDFDNCGYHCWEDIRSGEYPIQYQDC